MSSAAVIGIVVATVVVLGAVVFLTAARRTDVRGAGALSRETRRRDQATAVSLPDAPTGREVEKAASAKRSTGMVKADDLMPAPWVAPDADAIGVSRRKFFNRAYVGLMGLGLGGFAAASFVAFLWPTAGASGFGGKVSAGKLNDILLNIRLSNGFYYLPEARTWLTAYPPDAVPKAKRIYNPLLLPGMEAGLVALYQKCPHLGCRVPECKSSQWFECPCHGSQYNRVGEKKAGPAPRGMDRFLVLVSGTGDVTIDTLGGAALPGPAIGTNTTGQEAEGPHCITGGE
jgi:cytochrome b6-f complex iron-sulfur subunit